MFLLLTALVLVLTCARYTLPTLPQKTQPIWPMFGVLEQLVVAVVVVYLATVLLERK